MGVAYDTPSTLRILFRTAPGIFTVCSGVMTAGSMTHTSAAKFSAISAKLRVMNPQKYEAAKETRKAVKAMPNSRARYLARSAISILMPSRNTYRTPPAMRWSGVAPMNTSNCWPT